MKTEWKGLVLNTGLIRIQITNEHIANKGEWVMHVRELGWNTLSIGIPNTSTENEAKVAAVKKVRQHIKKMLNSLD